MSITFSAAIRSTVELDGETIAVWDCVEGDAGDLDVNMANGNAAHIADLLGITDLWDAEPVSAADFLGRVLVAKGIAPADEGTPAVQTGNIIECGRPAGYSDVRLNQLQDLAEFAARIEGAVISWG